jgi:glycosyltransferase involved in cell wall biosynthesis
LTGQFLPVVGGTELSTLREAQALQARGHVVRVLTLRHNPQWARREEVDKVPVRRIGGLFLRGRLRLRFGATWLAEARVWYELVRTRRRYDVIQLRQLGRLARPAVLASYLTGKPLVVRIACAPPQGGQIGDTRVSLYRDSLARTKATAGAHPKAHLMAYLKARGTTPDMGDLDTLRRVQWLAPLTLLLLRAPQVTFLALSARIRQHLIESGFAKNQIVLLPNGIDPLAYRDIAARRLCHQEAPAGESLTVVCVARLSYQKGQDVLLQAWSLVQESVPTARLILAGDGEQRVQLELLATDLGISDTVDFAGLVTDTRALLAAARVFALPSRYEGMPNALLEAMAAGLPCVATQVSGSEDAIVDGQSGLLVPPDDPGALASALVALLTNNERAYALGREAQAHVVHAFTQGQMLDDLVQIYSSLVWNGDASHLQTRSRLADSLRLPRRYRHPQRWETTSAPAPRDPQPITFPVATENGKEAPPCVE